MNRPQETQKVFDLYMKKHKELDSTWKDTPLTNFTRVLILAVQKGNVDLFDVIKTKFQYPRSRDATFEKYIKAIGTIYFGYNEQDTGMGGIFGSLLNGLLGQ